MKRLVLAAALLAAPLPNLAADVGVSISVGEPGFYGRIDIGSNLVPKLVLPHPVIIVPPLTGVVLPPIYLRVPPGYAKNWRKHCQEYRACGRRVYFIQDDWYNNVYVPHYRAHRAEYREEHREHRHEGNWEHGPAQGHGRGHGHDHGHGHGHDD